MIPVGAIGDRAPATQPCATMSVMRNGEIPARSATAIARGAISAAAAMFPAPIEAIAQRQAEEHDRDQSGISPAAPQRHRGPPGRACRCPGQGEQERHAHQRQEQIGGEAGQDLADRELRPQNGAR